MTSGSPSLAGSTSLAAIRDLRKKTKPPKQLFALADPVFTKEDERIKLIKKAAVHLNENIKTAEYISPFTFASMSIKKLLFSGKEDACRLKITDRLAEKLNILFDQKAAILKGFEATYSNLINMHLKDYLYIVFATHGILGYSNQKGILEPALLLSQYDPNGNILRVKRLTFP